MPANPITDPFPGEDLLGIEPQLSQQVDPGWRHRLSLFVGRALSDTALDSEQLYRAGLLATLGQAVSPGVVKGLSRRVRYHGHCDCNHGGGCGREQRFHPGWREHRLFRLGSRR